MWFISEVTLIDFLMFLAKTFCTVEVHSVWEYMVAQRDLRRSLCAIHIYLSSHQTEQGEIFHFIHIFVYTSSKALQSTWNLIFTINFSLDALLINAVEGKTRYRQWRVKFISIYCFHLSYRHNLGFYNKP